MDARREDQRHLRGHPANQHADRGAADPRVRQQGIELDERILKKRISAQPLIEPFSFIPSENLGGAGVVDLSSLGVLRLVESLFLYQVVKFLVAELADGKPLRGLMGLTALNL